MVDTPNGLLGQHAVPLVQADYSTEIGSVKIHQIKMAGKIARLWDRIERKSVVTRIYVPVSTKLFDHFRLLPQNLPSKSFNFCYR